MLKLTLILFLSNMALLVVSKQYDIIFDTVSSKNEDTNIKANFFVTQPFYHQEVFQVIIFDQNNEDYELNFDIIDGNEIIANLIDEIDSSSSNSMSDDTDKTDTDSWDF